MESYYRIINSHLSNLLPQINAWCISVHGILSQRINSAVGPYLRVYTNPGLPDCRQAGGHYRPPCEIKAKLLLQWSISQGATLGFVMNRFTAFRQIKGMVFQITMQFRRLFKALLNPRYKYRVNRYIAIIQ